MVYAAAVAVLIAGALYASGEVLTLRRSQAEQLLMLVSAVGETSARVAANRPMPAPARRALAALHADPDIRAAALYDAGGKLLADVGFGPDSGSSSERLRAWAIDPAGAAATAVQYQWPDAASTSRRR